LELEDIQFLIKNAAALFPPNPEHITGPGIRSAVWGLQNDLIRQRQAVVDKLLHVLVNGLYPDREPQEVAQLAAEVITENATRHDTHTFSTCALVGRVRRYTGRDFER